MHPNPYMLDRGPNIDGEYKQQKYERDSGGETPQSIRAQSRRNTQLKQATALYPKRSPGYPIGQHRNEFRFIHKMIDSRQQIH